MKKSIQIIATAFAILLGNVGFSQLDSVYVVKNGFVTHAIKQSDVDSIIFYRPVTPITDLDGNVYTSVTIGTQEWMVENLRTTTYSDGTTIPNVTINTDWGNLSTGAWCHYNNDNQHETAYGKLYNWYAINTTKLCPTGWHVPTDSEWTVLEEYLGANGHNGAKGTALKATSGWSSGGNGTDDYGWLGLPGGLRLSDGRFSYFSSNGFWWSSSEGNTSNAWGRNLVSDKDNESKAYNNKEDGGSVRCLRD